MRRLFSIVALATSTQVALPAQAQHENSVGSPDINAPADVTMTALPDLEPYPEVRAHLAKGQYKQALLVLQAQHAGHENDANYFNLLGILALKTGDYAAAVAALERVVLMQPDNAGAWLDLAIASFESGNPSSAAGYFNYLEAQFSPPPAVRAVIARYRSRIAAPLTSPSWHAYIDATSGIDSNANSGLQYSAIPLTFGTERITLLLDPAFRARSDRFTQFGAGVRHQQQFNGHLLELTFGARVRNYLHEHDFSTMNLNAGANIHWATTSWGDISSALYLEQLWLGGNSLLRGMRGIAQIERAYQHCRLGATAEAEWRRYATLSNLNANLVWTQIGIACDWRLKRIPIQTTLIGRGGIDTPIAHRPGGKTIHHELIAQVGAPLAWGARAELSLTLAKSQDAQGYSPLLEQNAARVLHRRNIRFSLSYPYTAATELMLIAEDNQFTSNLALFQQAGKSLSVGLRYRF